MSTWGFFTWGQAWGPATRGLCVVKFAQAARVEIAIKPKSTLEVRAVYSVLKSNVIQIEARFFKDGVYTDPTTVTLALKKPDGTAYSPALTMAKLSTGVWSADFDTQGQAAGVWSFRAEGDGVCDAAAEGSFEIKASAVV